VFVGNLGDNLTLRDLKTDYGVNLPSYIYDGNEDKSVNEIENIINNMYVADFLGYTIDDSDLDNIIVKNGTEDVTGLMYELAIEKVENLANVQDKFKTLTATDLEDVMDLSSLNNILSKTQTYSIVGTKLCEEGTTTEVSFEYKIEGSYVIVDNTSFEINSNEVEIILQHLPLATAISAFTSDMGNKLTIAELADYGVTLPDFITKGNSDRPIADIKTIIDDLYVADVLGYTIDGSTVKDEEENPVTGIMGIIAQKKINQLNDIQSTIEAQTIATLMDYKISADNKVYDDKNNNSVLDSGEEVTGLLGKVAKYTILNVDDAINDLVLSDVFSSSQLSSGILSLIGADTKVVDIPDEVDNIIKKTSVNELIAKGIIDTTDVTPTQLAKLQVPIQFDIDGDNVKDSTTVGALSLQQFMIYFLTM